MFVAVLIRRLKPGKTYDDFVEAWYPDKGFDAPVRGPDLAVNVTDPREILALATIDLPDRPSLDRVAARIAEQEALRHDRIAGVIEATTVHAVYEVTDRFDFSSDRTVSEGRPAGLRGSGR